MFQIVILLTTAAAIMANPIYPGGMIGGIGTSSVSVTRRTNVMSPGMYGGGMMTPGMGVGMVYGGGTMGMLKEGAKAGEAVEETTVEKEKTVGPLGTTETVVEKEVELESPEAVEVMGGANSAPMGMMKSAAMRAAPMMGEMESVQETSAVRGMGGVVGGMGMVTPGIMGAESGSSRTDVYRAGIGGVEQSSVGESHVNTPFGSESRVTSFSESDRVL